MCLVNGKLLFALSFHFRLFLLWWYLSISRVGDLFKHKEWTNARNMHHQLNFFFLLSKCDLLGWLPIIFRPVTVVRFSLGVARPRSPSVVGARRDHHFWWGAQYWTRSWRSWRGWSLHTSSRLLDLGRSYRMSVWLTSGASTVPVSGESCLLFFNTPMMLETIYKHMSELFMKDKYVLLRGTYHHIMRRIRYWLAHQVHIRSKH